MEEKINFETLKDFYNKKYITNNSLYIELIKIDYQNISKDLFKLLIFVQDISSAPYKIGELNGAKFLNHYSLNNISMEEYKLIYNNIDFIDNFYVKGKICDFIWSNKWIKGKIFQILEKAISFYLQEIYYLIKNNIDDFNLFHESFDRYITLSTKLSFHEKSYEYLTNCIANIKEIIKSLENDKKYAYLDSLFTTLLSDENNSFLYQFIDKENIFTDKNIFKSYVRLIALYLIKYYEKEKYILFVDKLIPIKEKDSGIMYIFNMLAPKSFLQKKYLSLKRVLIYKIFHAYISEANGRKSNIEKSGFIQEAVIFGLKNNINKKLIEKYCVSLEECKEKLEFAEVYFKNTIHIESIKNLLECYKGYSLEQKISLLSLSIYDGLIAEDEFKKHIDDNIRKNPLRYLVNNVMYDINNNVKNRNNSKISETISYFQNYSSYISLLTIQPVLENIRQNHFLYPQFFRPLMHDNFFIPEGHELFFEKGIYHFFNNDMLEAQHLLILQFENSLRHLLRYKVSLVIQNLDGREKENIKIENLIDYCIEYDLIDRKILFYLKLIFDSDYINFRNDIAHGFYKSEDLENNQIFQIFVCLLLYILIYENKKYNVKLLK